MKVTFILPGIGKRKNGRYLTSWLMEPLTIAVLNSLVLPEWEREFYDDRIENINYETNSDLVLITVETYTCARAYHIAGEFRKRGKTVILGGYHVTLIPEEALEHADCIITENADLILKTVLTDFASGNLQRRYNGGCCINYTMPDRSIYSEKMKKYLPVSLVETGRGCRHNCEFCSISGYYRSRYIHREVKDIIADMKSCRHKLYFLVDDSILSDRSFARELFTEIKKLHIRWTTQITLDIAADENMLKLMKASGCEMVLIGFESVNRENLEQMNKGWTEKIGTVDGLIESVHRAGIGIYASFVFGFDSDTEQTFKDTLEFCNKHRFFVIALNHLLIFPGTATYNRMSSENRLLSDKWWLEKGYTYGKITFLPRLMSPDELRRCCKDYKREYFRFGSIIRRGFTCISRSHGFLINFAYWFINILFHFELNARVGLPIGENLDNK